MNNLFKRTLTGILIVTVLVGGISWSPVSFFIVFLLLTLASVNEFYTLSKKVSSNPLRIPGLILSGYLFSTIYAVQRNWIDPKYILGIIPIIFFIFISELYRKQNSPFNNIAYTLLGVAYIALPFSMFSCFVFPNFLPDNSYSPQVLIALFVLLWTNDSGAYLIGSRFGKHRLFERISPKKSWEGFIGGAFFSTFAAVMITFFYKEIPLIHLVIINLIAITAGTFGDLCESMFKRKIGEKDSGNFFPGHGGFLDRFDSILMAVPMVYFYVQMINL